MEQDLKSSRNILLTISYDGTHFSGWQKQTKEGEETFRTVQGELEKALEKIHKHPIELHGSGRTDSGVHAVGQAANFFTDIDSMQAENFLPALNSILPRDIRIMSARHVSKHLNARFQAKARTYHYVMHCGSTIEAHQTPYSWHIFRYPDISRLNSMAQYLRGELNCTTFSAAGDQSNSKSRHLYKAHFFFDREKLIFEISANAFLWRMVRSITGTLLDFERTKTSPGVFKEILHAKDRSLVGPTAPPQGLFLWSITYPENLLKG